MDEETKVLRDYLAFTVPHITVFVGAVFGILLLVGIDRVLAVGIFALLYGIMLAVLGLIIRPHIKGSRFYLVFLLFALSLVAGGIALLLAFFGE
jgi:hypothetical protein